MREIGPDTLISVAAPVYNEKKALPEFVHEIVAALKGLNLGCKYELVLADDGSTDGSTGELERLAGEYRGVVRVVRLSRNFGHSSAVSAALDHTRGDAVILMDSDMQDDPAAFAGMIEKWRAGSDVVYAVRSSREEAALLRTCFWFFYRMMSWMALIKLPADAGNFSLMDRRVVDALRKAPERNRYLPGLRAWAGFSQTGIDVPRRARYDGANRVGLRGLWKLAFNAVFSFSYVPIFVFRILGAVSLAMAGGLIVWAFYRRITTGYAVEEWTSQFIAVSFFGGINLLGISVVGEYVARIYDEVKQRPEYVVASVTPEPGTDESSG